MDYPGTWLNSKVRFSLMICLIISFFIIAPIILLYTAGYRYDWSKKQVNKTGVISIDAEPRDVQVVINGINVDSKMPIWLPNRAPGVYSMLIKKDGYWDWQKEINVESQKTSYIRQISLFKKSTPQKLEQLNEMYKLFFFSDGRYIAALKKIDNKFELKIFDTFYKNFIPVKFDKYQTEPTINISPFQSNILIVDKNNVEIMEINNTNNRKKYKLDSMVEKMQWKNSSDLVVYISDKNNIYNINLDKIEKISKNTKDPWYIDNIESLWVLKDGLLLNEKKEIQMPFTDKVFDIVNLEDNKFIGQKENEMVIMTYEKKQRKDYYSIPTNSYFFDTYKKEWLTWSPWEVWTIYNDGTSYLLNRISEKINFIRPLDNFGVILIVTDNNLIAFNAGYYVSNTLLTSTKIYDLSVDRENRKINFYGEINGEKNVFQLEY